MSSAFRCYKRQESESPALKLSGAGIFRANTPTKSVLALLFYSGTHTDMFGNTDEFNDARIEAIATASNSLAKSGRRIKLYKDHNRSQESAFGVLTPPFFTQRIEKESDVPFEGAFEELKGRLGIYCQVNLSSLAAGDYNDSILKEISVGLDWSASLGFKDAIFELSAVGIQSLTGAGLFSLFNEYALTIEESREGQQIRESISHKVNNLHEHLWTLERTIDSISEASDEAIAEKGMTRRELMAKATRDTLAVLTEQLSDVPPPVPPTPVFQNQGEEMTPEEQARFEALEKANTDLASKFEAMQADNATLKAQNQQFSYSQQIVERFANLRRRADALKNGGVLTPDNYRKYGFDQTTVDGIVGCYSANIGEGADKFAHSIRELDKVEAKLEALEECGKPAIAGGFGSLLDKEPIGTYQTPDKQNQEKYDADLDAYLQKRGMVA